MLVPESWSIKRPKKHRKVTWARYLEIAYAVLHGKAVLASESGSDWNLGVVALDGDFLLNSSASEKANIGAL